MGTCRDRSPRWSVIADVKITLGHGARTTRACPNRAEPMQYRLNTPQLPSLGRMSPIQRECDSAVWAGKLFSKTESVSGRFGGELGGLMGGIPPFLLNEGDDLPCRSVGSDEL